MLDYPSRQYWAIVIYTCSETKKGRKPLIEAAVERFLKIYVDYDPLRSPRRLQEIGQDVVATYMKASPVLNSSQPPI